MSVLVSFLLLQQKLLTELLEKLEQNKDNNVDSNPELTLVFGNESCDLDSQVSALYVVIFFGIDA